MLKYVLNKIVDLIVAILATAIAQALLSAAPPAETAVSPRLIYAMALERSALQASSAGAADVAAGAGAAAVFLAASS